MTVKAVLFDLFDTLIIIRKNHDFYSPSLMRTYQFLKTNGMNVEFEVFERAYNQARDDLYTKANPNLEEPHFNLRIAQTLENLGFIDIANSQIVQAASSEFCDEFVKYVYIDESAQNILNYLKEKYKLGIISNFAIPECVDRLLQSHQLISLFDVILISAAVNKRKPSPEIFEKASNTLQVLPSETVFVGDTLDADIDGAKSAGMKAIYIERKVESTADHATPDKRIKSLTELPSVLENLS